MLRLAKDLNKAKMRIPEIKNKLNAPLGEKMCIEDPPPDKYPVFEVSVSCLPDMGHVVHGTRSYPYLRR
jgi:hypothetical protein